MTTIIKINTISKPLRRAELERDKFATKKEILEANQ